MDRRTRTTISVSEKGPAELEVRVGFDEKTTHELASAINNLAQAIREHAYLTRAETPKNQDYPNQPIVPPHPEQQEQSRSSFDLNTQDVIPDDLIDSKGTISFGDRV